MAHVASLCNGRSRQGRARYHQRQSLESQLPRMSEWLEGLPPGAEAQQERATLEGGKMRQAWHSGGSQSQDEA